MKRSSDRPSNIDACNTESTPPNINQPDEADAPLIYDAICAKCSDDGHIALPDRLHLATEWPRDGARGVERISEWIGAHPGARLVIVDVLAMFKAVSRGKEQTLYEGDYAAIKGLQSLAMATGVAIIVVHHTRKSAAETDPFEKVSGTLGLSGAADTTLILDRDSNGCTIYGRGRDIQEIESAVEFDTVACRWNLLGEASEVRRTDERGAILRVLADADEPMGPTEVADLAGMSNANVRKLLARMVKAGEAVKHKRGQYVHKDHAARYADKRDPDKFVPPKLCDPLAPVTTVTTSQPPP